MPIKKRTQEVIERAYLSLQQIIAELYIEAENAVIAGNYNDASLLFSQADKLYQATEDLGIMLAEQEE